MHTVTALVATARRAAKREESAGISFRPLLMIIPWLDNYVITSRELLELLPLYG